MKRLIVVFAFLLSVWMPCQVRADQTMKLLEPWNKTSNRKTSDSPQGARTLRIGTIDTGLDNGKTLLHFYALPTQRHSASVPPEMFYLDIFSVADQKSKKINTLRLDNLQIPVEAKSWLGNWLSNLHQGKIGFMWLEPKQQRGPVLMLHSDSAPGRTQRSYWMLFPFPRGWNENTTMEVFGDVGQGSGSRLHFYTDKQGFMSVNYTIWERVDSSPEVEGFPGYDNYVFEHYHWDGTRFGRKTQEGEFKSM